VSSAVQETTALAELERLLSEDPAAAAERASRRLDLHQADIVLYGAGTLGLAVLSRLRRAGLDAAAFADDTPEKQGTFIEGVPVMTVRDAAAHFGERALFVVTILNPLLRFVDARARLQPLTNGRVVSFLDVAWMHPDAFLPYYQFERPELVLSKRDAILRAASIFADEESVRQFTAHLQFRLHLDYDAIPPNSHDDYFPPGVFDRLSEDAVFVDCGAFDGDTVRTFLAQQNGKFGEIHAFEPDERNCAKLRAYAQSLPEEQRSRVYVHCAAVGDQNGTLRFNSTGNMSASLSDSGTVEVPVVRVDDKVNARGRQVYVKYDVEGGEWEALRGTEGLFAGRPILAVSIYHRPDDLWQLPLYLDSLGIGYQLYLRTQGEDGMDVICYAVPN
jgi:FkbM family methyltransferase